MYALPSHGGGLRCLKLGLRRTLRRTRARSAAGVTWTCRTASAPWAGRRGHTSVVDAAGAIYVIGGVGYDVYQDVWASTDGGARAGLTSRGWSAGTRGGTQGVLRGY